jgi:hypothetical protein
MFVKSRPVSIFMRPFHEVHKMKPDSQSQQHIKPLLSFNGSVHYTACNLHKTQTEHQFF